VRCAAVSTAHHHDLITSMGRSFQRRAIRKGSQSSQDGDPPKECVRRAAHHEMCSRYEHVCVSTLDIHDMHCSSLMTWHSNKLRRTTLFELGSCRVLKLAFVASVRCSAADSAQHMSDETSRCIIQLNVHTADSIKPRA